MDEFITTGTWEEIVGEQVRALRIARNIDQREMAAQAGIALNAVKRLENGKGSTLASLIKVLAVLDKTMWLGTLNPEEIEEAAWWNPRARAPKRKRVSKRGKDKEDEGT